MRIAVDGYELNSEFTGVGRFLKNLIFSIAKIDKNNSYTLFLREEFDIGKEHLNIIKIVLRSKKSYTKWQNSNLIKALNSGGFDLFFSPNHSIPFFYKGNSLMTIPDVSWRGVPEDFSVKERFTRDIKTKFSIKKCPLIFTISEFSKSEIIKYYNTPSKKIVPVHLGIEDKFKRIGKKETDDFRKKYNLGNGKLIGFLGSMFKRRHIEDIIDAFDILKRNRDIKLILIGANRYNRKLKGLNGSNIIHLDRIQEEEINSFYSSLNLFIYLSDYEGFGFPPLEALSCKTPSLLLNTSSLGEVYKDLAFFINNTKPQCLSKKICEILESGKSETDRYLEEFIRRKDYFSWERSAGEFLNHFNNIMDDNR